MAVVWSTDHNIKLTLTLRPDGLVSLSTHFAEEGPAEAFFLTTKGC